MTVFITGATGFIGSRLARRLRERGDEVVALVRSPASAADLTALGCELLPGDLGDDAAIRAGVARADSVIHAAAIYEVGVLQERCREMYEVNVRGTERVLRAALAAGTGKVVYVSTVGAFGNTEGRIVDESYEHPGRYVSCYDETKHLAHKAARRLIKEGLPCAIVQPGAVYGPNDHSAIGDLLQRFLRGRLPLLPFPELGASFVHVDDVVAGILLVLDRGRTGEQYVLGGEIARVRELAAKVAALTGRKAPRWSLPTGVMKATAPFGRVVGPLMGFPPNFREVISASDGVTYWARHDKAARELGYSPRSLDEGLRDLLAATR